VTLMIGANERNILHRLMLNRLFVLGERPDELARMQGISTLELGREFGEDLELMRDLGWLCGGDLGQSVALHRPPEPLAKALRRLGEDARPASEELRVELDSTETAEERRDWFQLAVNTCNELLGMVERQS
jgi:hypothetical protein